MKHVYLFDIDGTLYNNKFHEIDSHLTEEFQYLVDQGDLIFCHSSAVRLTKWRIFQRNSFVFLFPE